MMQMFGNAGISLDVSAFQGGVHPASQNLFEAMALQARDRHAYRLSDVGQALAKHLDGYLERTRLVSERVEQLSSGDIAKLNKPASSETALDPDRRVMTVLQSMHRMFDYSIETQVVVRSATQMSGAVNTLLRGQ